MWPTATAESLGAKQRANPSPDYQAAGRRLIAGNAEFSTSYALSGEEKEARAAGCDEYVPKPFSPRQLLAKIRNFLR
jgi:CheY-like chemotaxis protein